MFKINFRIVDDFEELKNISIEEFNLKNRDIYGFFEVCFNNHIEGSYYHNNILKSGEIGDEIINYWLNSFLDVLIYLKTKTNYVAFLQIETINRWIEFKKTNEYILINIGIDIQKINLDLFLFKNNIYFRPIIKLNGLI